MAAEPTETMRKYERNCTAELFVRSLAPTGAHPQQERVLDRIEALQQEGQIASASVTVWGNGIAPESATARTETGQVILETVAEFTRWASRNDRSFPSAFDERERTSMIDGDHRTMIPFPTMCLAIRDGDELQCVAPCSGDGLTHSVHDCLNELGVDEQESSVHDWESGRNGRG
ncbi:hypothetical protein C449_08974 [Halococcus saccharolyticus DSM 5350]|uniref:Uncharacterized protein n=1 Tax=Halococcus saccharolyticus DSM 5350 TaxID=1227455 RepID=M0MHF4_9EURY|nr:HTH domain-containing protein [Halococcus saccharolyticus]EMA44778.1 hypothetical protein C449_08974 [Halococcus saccharolyticus DSM 5350]